MEYTPQGSAEAAKHRAELQRLLGDSCELRGLLGRGGFADVFEAWDPRLKRLLAVKTLRTDLVASEALVERFRLEAQAIAQLRHPHVIPIYTVGGEGSIGYFVMPKVDGESLASLLGREKQLSVEESCRILREAVGALSTAHRAGIIHRDIKPENILLDGAERRVLVMDFGIAKSLDSMERGLTGTGVLVGTPQYMSPEQAAGDRSIDHRSDQYALATVGYRMLTGHLPFDGDSVQTVIFKQVTEPPRPILEVAPAVPVAIAAVIERALSKSPADRFESIDAFGAALDKALQEGAAKSGRAAVPNMATRIDGMRRSLPGWKNPLTIAGIAAAVVALALGPRTVFHSAYTHGAARDDAVFAAKSFLAARGVTGSLAHFAEFRNRDTLMLYRFLLATIGGKAIEARVAKDIPFWTWRVHITKDGEKRPWIVDVGLANRVVGFGRQLPDTASAPRITITAAEPIALRELAAHGFVPASLRRLADSTITRTNRTDHLFRWARPETAIPWSAGDTAFGMVSVRVTGSDVAAYSEFVETPQRYRQQNDSTQRTAVMGIVIILILLAGMAVGFGLLFSRSRQDELQWPMGLRLGLGVLAVSAPKYLFTSLGHQLVAPSNPDMPIAFGIAIGVALGAFIFGLVLISSVLSESLAALHRPSGFAGMSDLTKGRFGIPELVSAAAFGAILGSMLAAIEQVIRFGGLLITGTSGVAGVHDLITASIPALDTLDMIGESTAGTILVCCLQLVLYHWRRSATLAIGGAVVVVVGMNFLTPDPLMVSLINSIVWTAVTGVVLWRFGFLTAVFASFVSEKFVALSAMFWSGASGGTGGAVLAALVFLAPFALGLVAYRRLNATPARARSAPAS